MLRLLKKEISTRGSTTASHSHLRGNLALALQARQYSSQGDSELSLEERRALYLIESDELQSKLNNSPSDDLRLINAVLGPPDVLRA